MDAAYILSAAAKIVDTVLHISETQLLNLHVVSTDTAGPGDDDEDLTVMIFPPVTLSVCQCETLGFKAGPVQWFQPYLNSHGRAGHLRHYIFSSIMYNVRCTLHHYN